MSESNSILVTGGAGFIGSALVWALNEKGYENILISDCLGTDEKWRNLVGLRYADYIDAADLKERVTADPKHLGEIESVFHLGACSATTEKDSDYLMRNNYEYTKILAHWALGIGARFAYASSAATYGDGEQGMDDKDPKIEKLRPLNMYGYSKHLFDLYAKRTGILSKIVGLKYFNVFGPNENHKGDMRSVVNKAFSQIQETGQVKLFKSYKPEYKDGEQMRDFLYVKDAVEMTIHLSASNEVGGLFNLGSGEANTWVQLANAIFKAMGLPPKIEFVDMPEQLQAKYQYYTCADIQKLRDAHYTAPVTSLETSVADYVQSYLMPDRLLGM